MQVDSSMNGGATQALILPPPHYIEMYPSLQIASPSSPPHHKPTAKETQFQQRSLQGILLPPGLKFAPTEDQLVGYYLYRKLTDKLSILDESLVKVCDLYGEEHPWQIFERLGNDEEDLYIFTQMKKSSKQGSRINRKIGSTGAPWHGVDSGIVEVCGRLKANKEKVRLLE